MSSYGDNNRQFLALPGAAGVPGFSFINATKTGMYLPAANSLALSTNATNALYINSSQQVGIGTSSPNYKLHTVGASAAGSIYTGVSNTDATAGSTAGYVGTASGTNNYFTLTQTVGGVTYLVNAGAGSLTIQTTQAQPLIFAISATERMRIDTSGNVGIGTSAPAAKLDIGTGNLNFSGSAQRITGDFSNATYANRVMFQNSVTNGRTNISALPNGTSTTAGIDLYGSSSDPANTSLFRIANTNAEYQFEGTKTGTGSYLPVTIYTGGSERMRIDTSGNVLVGITTTPTVGTNVTKNLVVSNDISLGSLLIGTNGSYLGRQSSDGSTILNTGQANIIFSNGVYGSTATERMRIDSSGNVGIGTSAPGTKLDVSGSIRSTSGNIIAADGSGFAWGAASTYVGGTSASSLMTFNTASTERMRIDSSGNVGIGATANASAILDAQSTTKGVRFPNMTTTQKNAISSPAAGLVVFDTTLAKLCVYTGAAWQTITSA